MRRTCRQGRHLFGVGGGSVVVDREEGCKGKATASRILFYLVESRVS